MMQLENLSSNLSSVLVLPNLESTVKCILGQVRDILVHTV